MWNSGRVSFSLRGDFNTKEITDCLGVKPTHALNKGETNPAHIIPRCSIWDYSSQQIEDEYLDIYLLADEIVSELVPHTEAIKMAVKRWHLHPTLLVTINMVIDKEASTPAIGFSIPVIKFLADTGTSIEIDTYRNYTPEI